MRRITGSGQTSDFSKEDGTEAGPAADGQVQENELRRQKSDHDDGKTHYPWLPDGGVAFFRPNDDAFWQEHFQNVAERTPLETGTNSMLERYGTVASMALKRQLGSRCGSSGRCQGDTTGAPATSCNNTRLFRKRSASAPRFEGNRTSSFLLCLSSSPCFQFQARCHLGIAELPSQGSKQLA